MARRKLEAVEGESKLERFRRTATDKLQRVCGPMVIMLMEDMTDDNWNELGSICRFRARDVVVVLAVRGLKNSGLFDE